jgi:hypothetical protein
VAASPVLTTNTRLSKNREQLVAPKAVSNLFQFLAEAQAGERGAKSIPLSIILPNFPITAHPRRSVEF